MKIYINEIPAEGLEVRQEYDFRPLDLETEEIKFAAPLSFSGRISIEQENLRIKGEIVANIEFLCSRCADSFQRRISKELELNYFVKGKDFLDITDALCQEIILEYPLKPLCKEDCRGLCPRCGQDLNEGECNCKRRDDGFTQKTPFQIKA